VTAELAVALPAVLLVLAACLGALRLGAEQVLLTDAAGLAARSAARHDPPARTATLLRATTGRLAAVSRSGGVVCAEVAAEASLVGVLVSIPIRARGCALDPDR
jgi:hypothetical protein